MKETFFEAFFSLTRLFLSVKDNFLKQKLAKKIEEFFMAAQDSAHVSRSVEFEPSQVDLAPYQRKAVLKLIIEELNEFIDLLIHFKISDLSPALLAQKKLLVFYLEIINCLVSKTEAAKPKLIHNKGLTFFADKFVKGKTKHSKERIIEYLKTRPFGAQVKEMVSVFQNQFSRRTLQRHLNDLLEENVLVKNKDDGFPRYNLAQDRTLVAEG